MKTEAPKVPLREVMRLSIDAVPVDLLASYPIAGVYSFGRGLLARKPIAGSETTYKVLHRLHTDDFVMSQLKAWEGALARIPPSFEGWFLSPQFPTFRAIPNLLDIGYLDWFCRQSRVWEELRVRSRGMGARRDSVSPDSFLSIEIPLPPLAEQRRIVARLEELNAKIREGRQARNESIEEACALFGVTIRQRYQDLLGQTETSPLGSLVTVMGGGTPAKSNPFFWQGRIPWVSPKDMKIFRLLDAEDHISQSAIESSAAKLIEPDAVLVVIRGMILAHSFPVAVAKARVAINQDMKALVPSGDLHSDYVAYMLRGAAPDILDMVERSSHDTRRLATEDLLSIPIPVLRDPEDQREVVAYLDKLGTKCEELTRLEVEVSAEIDALISSVLDRSFGGGF